MQICEKGLETAKFSANSFTKRDKSNWVMACQLVMDKVVECLIQDEMTVNQLKSCPQKKI